MRQVRRRKIQQIKLVLPAAWACALINNDWSGLDPQETADLAGWSEATGHGPGDCLDVGDSYFAWSNDATTLGGEVADFVFMD